jgi:hypothetical protein
MAERPPEKPLSSEAFEALLLEIRNGAQAVLSDFAHESVTEGEQHDAKIEDARAVWHTAEFALGMLNPGRYLPKREALEEAAELIDRLGDTRDIGGEG